MNQIVAFQHNPGSMNKLTLDTFAEVTQYLDVDEFFRLAWLNRAIHSDWQQIRDRYFRAYFYNLLCYPRVPLTTRASRNSLRYLLQERQLVTILQRWTVLHFLAYSQWRFCPVCRRRLGEDPRFCLSGRTVERKDVRFVWMCSGCLDIDEPGNPFFCVDFDQPDNPYLRTDKPFDDCRLPLFHLRQCSFHGAFTTTTYYLVDDVDDIVQDVEKTTGC